MAISFNLSSSSADNIPLEKPSKYEPSPGKVLFFVGQDNESVGGNDRFNGGYVDTVGTPFQIVPNITHYIYFSPGWTNAWGKVFPANRVAGLNYEDDWAGGAMCLKYYLDSPALKKSIFHLSLSMEGRHEALVAAGAHDNLIAELGNFLKSCPDRIFLIRIGYEFDGAWNSYDSNAFKAAFVRIVSNLRASGAGNFASVMAASSPDVGESTWNDYYPGDEYVDWVGYSYWSGNSASGGSLSFARKHHKPVIIAESAPRNVSLGSVDGGSFWNGWYETFFQHIRDNIDVIRAVSYINCNWQAQKMWAGSDLGDTRVQTNPVILSNWVRKMRDPMFIQAVGNWADFLSQY